MDIPNHTLRTAMTDLSGLQQPQWKHPLLGVALFLICLFTVAGNCLVVCAVYTVKSLRNPTGYFIVSLALADLIVGMVVMPLNGLFEMTGHVWLLGLAMCDVFHAMDILASTSSIWSLCVIAVDRYVAGKYPLRYRNRVSKRRILVAISFIWLFSASLSFPAIIWWRRSSPHLYVDHRKCVFTDNKVYIVFSSLLSFYVPMFVLLFAYGKVLAIATQHSASLRSGIKRLSEKGDYKKYISETIMDPNYPVMRVHRGNNVNGITKRMTKSANSEDTSSFVSKQNFGKTELLAVHSEKQLTTPRPFSSIKHNSDQHSKFAPNRVKHYGFIAQTSELSTSPFLLKRSAAVREKSRLMMKYMQEQRAARTLFVVVGVFIICWTPFFICSPIITLCTTCFDHHELIYSLATWAGHLNSLLNPVIYPRFSREFRRAFKQILTCERRRGVRTAMNTPFDFVFAQLIAVTHFWDSTTTDIHERTETG